MTAEPPEMNEGEASTGGGDPGLPADFFVGVTLLSVALFIFVLSAAGVLGKGGSGGEGGHGTEPASKQEAPEGSAEKGGREATGRAGEEAGKKAGAPAKGTEAAVAETAEGEAKRVHLRKGAEPIDPAGTKVVLLPCDIKTTYELGMSLEKVSDILSEGCTKAFGGMGVSLKKIKARLSKGKFEGLSRRLASGAYRAIRWSGSFDLAADRFVAESRDLPSLIRKAVDLAEQEGVVDFEARYVFGLTVVGMGPGEGNRKKVLVMACLYDLEEKRVHSCVFYPEVLPAEKLPIQQRFAFIPGEAIERLMGKAAKKR